MKLATITHRRDFLAAGQGAQKFITGCFILLCVTRAKNHPATTGARVGFTVSRKMGGAVSRNRIKRRLREAVRASALAHLQEGRDYIFISRHKALTCSYPELLRDMEFAFSRIHSMKNGPNEPKPSSRKP